MRLSSSRVKIHQNFVIFEKRNQCFYKFYITLQCHETIPPYFVVEILYTFNKSSLSKTNLVKFHVSMRKSEILHFDELLCLTHIKFKLKKYRRFVSHSSEEWCKISRKKNWFVVSNMTWGIWWIFRQPVKSLKISLLWALFVQSKWGLC